MTEGARPPAKAPAWLVDALGLAAAAACATLAFATPTLDLFLARRFYAGGPGAPWPWQDAGVCQWLYRTGPWPALAVGAGAVAVLVAGIWRPRLARWRTHALFLALLLLVGPLLVVNVGFKEHWGRPRPRDIVEFGGDHRYRAFYDRGPVGGGESFPSGHSSMGFYFVGFYFLARQRHPRGAVASLAAAGLFGTAIGAARMAVGAHFASDIAWSAIITTAVAWALHYSCCAPLHLDTPVGST